MNDGDAMLPTLANGDRVLVNRLASPGVDDVVIVTVDGIGGTRRLVKRVVAVGGDAIAYVGCRLTRNGTPVDGYETIDEPCVGGGFAETTVPAGTVFLLGDNGPASSDSREFSPVRTGAVIGVVVTTL